MRANVSIRNYGFFVTNYDAQSAARDSTAAATHHPYTDKIRQAYANKPALAAVTDPYYRGFDQKYADYWRYREWQREFDLYAKNRTLPALELVRLPHDHFGDFAQANDGVNTVETQMADNDYALGKLIEHVLHSKYRDNTLIVVVEDDAQNGADHVDAHRSLAYWIGPYVRQHAVVSTRYTTVNLLRTIEDILGLTPLGITDGNAVPMSEVFEQRLQTLQYTALVPEVLRTTQLPLPPRTAQNSLIPSRLTERYAQPKHTSTYWAHVMQGQDFSIEDHLDTARFNQALMLGLKNDNP